MDLLRVGAATLNQTPLDFAGNADRIRAILREARTQGVELLCLPELAITGYGCEDAFFSLSTARKAEATLLDLLPETDGLTVIVGLPHYYYGAMYNCAAMLQDGRILGLNAKRVLPREGVHYEPRWFRPWPFGKVVETRIGETRVPLGDLRYRLGSIGVAIEICEEAWDSVPASAAHADSVDLILNPSASHFALGKYAKREHLVANSSRSLRVTYVYTNLVGLEAGRIIYDGGALIAEGGEIVTRGPRFGFNDGAIVWRDINPDLSSLAKLTAKPVREADDTLPHGADDLGRVEIQGRDPRSGVQSVPGREGLKGLGARASAPYVPLSRYEEFLHAEMLGLFDYMRKTGAQGYVVSLSGGSDSAACAVLVAHMIASAMRELGDQSFVRRLHLKGAPTTDDPRRMVGYLLRCIYQKTAHSGPVTEGAAKTVAEAIGASFHVVDVQVLVEGYTRLSEGILGRSLSWEQDDITLQNVQARTRAPLAWTVANATGAILLTTSNRSEVAVGYATMDGDTAGGLAPLAGIDKPFLREWLMWAEKHCSQGLGPLPALAAVNTQAPTAELRPAEQQQTDEADLMPYAVLERIERYLVRDRLGPEDLLATLRFDFPEMPAADLRAHVNRFYRLWAQSQWKRERMAPAFHLDDESLDPKTWCRYPILSRPPQL